MDTRVARRVIEVLTLFQGVRDCEEIMIRFSRVVSALQNHWHTQAPAELVTVYPGVAVSSLGQKQWVEFWVTQAQEAAPRTMNWRSMNVLVDVHCFHRSLDKSAALKLSDCVRRTLGQLVLPIEDSENDERNETRLRMMEGTTRDLTRESASQTGGALQHLVISFQGIVQQTPRQPD